MTTSFALDPPDPSCDAAPDASRGSDISELFSEIGGRFERAGAVGLVLIGAPMVAEIERRHGDEARMRCLESLRRRVVEIAEERLRSDFIVCQAEQGAHELMVLLFRKPGSAGFYRTEMPGFRQELSRSLRGDGGQVFYPYQKGAAHLPTGMSVELRNPQFGRATQLRRLIDEARRDCHYDIESTRRETRQGLLETILDHRIYSVYEPIVEVESRTVFGYEALARGPEGSHFHSPVALFSAAEEHGLVFELDCVCRESGLRGAIDFPAGTKLFLNIRPTAIHDPSFREDRLIETLERRQLVPTDVVFEISEQESITSFGAFREMADYYRSLGFQFALDDTGTGYAGLEELLEVEPEYIKIDRAMVSGVDQDPARQGVLTALLQIADKMGSQVIGEGLDTLEELEMLGRLGIRFGQGWLFGHPTPLRAAE
ncbi:MAG: EAL domain-containing protein [bacterium]|nr:EAL domain-containing protein [bacterium]